MLTIQLVFLVMALVLSVFSVVNSPKSALGWAVVFGFAAALWPYLP